MQVALAAMAVLEQSLKVLRATTSALRVAEQEVEPCIVPRSATEPLAPEVPKVLPVLHLAWAPLMAVLKVRPVTRCQVTRGQCPSFVLLVKLRSCMCRVCSCLLHSTNKHSRIATHPACGSCMCRVFSCLLHSTKKHSRVGSHTACGSRPHLPARHAAVDPHPSLLSSPYEN